MNTLNVPHHRWQQPLTARRWPAWLLMAGLVVFYVLLYKFPQTLGPLIRLFDPLSQWLNGGPATEWFMYGVLYTAAIWFFVLKVLARDWASRYQRFRTLSVMFFQTCLAFLLPQLLQRLHLPATDVKDLWPLKYYYFFDWNIENHLRAGTLGLVLFCLLYTSPSPRD